MKQIDEGKYQIDTSAQSAQVDREEDTVEYSD